MKKKILLISESMSGGLRKHVVQLIENLNQNQFDIYLIHGTKTYDDAFSSEYETLKRYATIIPCSFFTRDINFKDDWFSYQFVLKQIKSIKPDIVHCHSSKAGVIGRIAAKRNSIDKIYFTPHAYSFLSSEFSFFKKIVFRSIERILSKYATTKTFNVSLGEKKAALKSKIDKSEKFEVIYNGLPEIELPQKKEAREIIGVPESSLVIGNNARMSEQKNPMLFMKIAKEMISKNRNIHFVWAGKGPLYYSVDNFIRENNLQNNVHLLGDRKDSEYIVAGYDIFLITSLYEGLPYAPIEAMRASIPIIATKVVGNTEIVKENYNGLFIDEINEHQKSIFSIVENNKMFSENSFLYYQKYFSLNGMINSIVSNYLEE